MKIIFAVLAFAIVFPLLSAGYLLSLDAFSVPGKMPWTSFWSPSFFFGNFLAALNIFLPSYWIQKLMLFAIFFLAGWGMARLAPVSGTKAKIFAGLLYSVNPFTYERVMAGQWWLLLAYASVPFVIEKMLKFSLFPLALLLTILANLSTHYFLIAGVLVLFYSLWKRKFRFITMLTGLLLILNINWLLALLFGRSEIAQSVSTFNRTDLLSFQSISDPNLGLVFNLSSGYGFWAEVFDYFISPKSVVIFWPVLSLFFIILAGFGAYRSVKNKNDSNFPLAVCLIVMAFLALDFAGGVALKPISGFMFYLYDKVPFLYGFREPQKLIGFVMLAYAYFGAVGLSAFKKPIFVVIAIVLVLLYTPTVFGGFWGQLKPVSYPVSWNRVNEILNKDKGNFLTVSFPWYQYLRYGFNNNQPVVNTAPYFFARPVITASYAHESRIEALHVDGLLRIEKEGRNLLGEDVFDRPDWGVDLAVIGVKYIILTKDDDWQTYHFLDQQKNLIKVSDSPEISLYENLSFN